MRLRRLLNAFSTLLLAAGAAAGPLTLRVTMPERLADSPTLLANIVLENTSSAAVVVPGIDAASFRFRITSAEDGGSGKFVITRTGTAVQSTRPGAMLLPGQAMTSPQNVFRDYPLGLPPGRYTLEAVYDAASADQSVFHGSVVSQPMHLVIEPRSTPEYREFLEVGRALHHRESDALSRVVSFAEAHPDFDFSPRMLESVLYELHGDTLARAANLLVKHYPNSDSAAVAQHALDAEQQVAHGRAEYEAWMTQLRAEAARPENAAIARDVARLGTIEAPQDFGAWQRFLEAHPDSYFSAEARWQLVNAVESGVLPPGETRERALARFYRDLVEHSPKSYWGARALRNPSVAAMLSAATQ